MKGKTLKKLFSLFVIIGMFSQSGTVFVSFASDSEDSLIPFYGTKIIAEDYESYEIGETPESHGLRANQGTSTSDQKLLVAEDPLDSNNKVLKLLATSSATQTMAVYGDIPNTVEKDTWIEFDYYNPDNIGMYVGMKRVGAGWGTYVWGTSSTNVINMFNPGEQSWTAFGDNQKPIDKYVHVRMRMRCIDAATKKVEFTTDVFGYTSITCEKKVGVSWEAFNIELMKTSVADTGIYIDNLAIYTAKDEVSTEYVEKSGVVAEDTTQDYAVTSTSSVLYQQLENKGTGWKTPWYGSRIVTNAINGMTSGNALIFNDEKNYTTASGVFDVTDEPMYKRYLEKAINLKIPGVYESEVEFGDASADGEMRLYFGDKNLYVSLKSENGMYTPSLSIGDNKTSGTAVSTDPKKVKLRVIVKDVTGNCDVQSFVKDALSDSYSMIAKSSDLKIGDIIGKDYLGWIGVRGTSRGLFKNFKVSKIDNGDITRTSFSTSETTVNGAKNNGVTVNATFTNSKKGNAVILPVIVAFDVNGNIVGYKKGNATTVKAFSFENHSIEPLTFDNIPESTKEIKFYFLNSFTNKPFKNCSEHTIVLK